MLNQDLVGLGKKRSTIREIFEYGNARAKEIGRENIFDFSIGNPNVPAPDAVRRTLLSLVENTDPVALHGYTSAQGAEPEPASLEKRPRLTPFMRTAPNPPATTCRTPNASEKIRTKTAGSFPILEKMINSVTAK